MAKVKSASKIKIDSFDDLFGTSVKADSNSSEQIVEVSLEDLHTFQNHPFRVLDDEKMEETVESIKKYGVLMPGIARPRKEGGYEIIAGHRRKRGCELAGKTTMPVFIREYTDDEAVVIMVDTNIQREDILPSEKAKAYRMKFEAMKHQGIIGGNTLEVLGEQAGESGKTVQRYVRLAYLCDDLLDLVDKKKIGFVQGVYISYLSEEEQKWVFAVASTQKISISTVQASKLKEYAKCGELTRVVVELVLSEQRVAERKITLKADKISQYFPKDYSNEDMEAVIIKLLDEWKSKQKED